MQRLASSRVAIFGLGGVGSWACEALARCGVGHFCLVDGDVVEKTNLNRQLIALHSTLGKPKVKVMAQRIADINPSATVEANQLFFEESNADRISLRDMDYIVDAIDTVSSKILLISLASEAGVPILSCMGTGNRVEADSFRIGRIEQTSGCPLARVMRRELRLRGIKGVRVLYSPQPPHMTSQNGASPASISFVPSTAGLKIAGEVIRQLIGKDETHDDL